MSVESIAISEPVLLIRISRTYRPGMSSRELYEATRGIWKLGKRREAARLAFAVYGGTVVEVYDIHEWHPAGASSYTSRTFSVSDLEGRWEFTGAPAPPAVRDRYV